MISLVEQSMQMVGQSEQIDKWVVWFQTPFGITPDLSEAIARCSQNDLDPELFVTPIPVVIGMSGRYEIFFPRR